MKDELLPLRHILDAINRVAQYTNDKTHDDFINDNKLYDAVLMQLIVIGEQASRISDDFKDAHYDIPWHKVIGMRNLISHNYASIKSKIAWDTAIEDLPKLKLQIEQLLGEK